MKLRALFAALLVTSSAAAEGARPVPSDEPARPVRHVSLELAPLAMLAHRYGGQIQIGVAGPVTLVGSASRVAVGDTQVVGPADSPDGGSSVQGAPSMRGWSFEFGPRLYVPAHRGPNRIDFFLGVSWLHDALAQGAKLTCPGGCDVPGRTVTSIPQADATRDGLAFDAGLQATFASGLLLSFGVGWQFTGGGALAPANDGWASMLEPSAYERTDSHPRILTTIGWTL